MTPLVHQRWLAQSIRYDGSQLRAHWIHDQTGLVGDAIVTFLGGAQVGAAHMVDLEDRAQQAWIFSEQMLHCLVEHFHGDLMLTIARQHLLVALAADTLRARVPGRILHRVGNDLFDVTERDAPHSTGGITTPEADRVAKLSVSIATASPVSTLIHLGINVSSANTPVHTRGLADYGIDPEAFAHDLMPAYAAELAHLHHARAKVRGVGCNDRLLAIPAGAD